MKIIKSVEEKRLYDGDNEKPFLINLKNYLNNSKVYDEVWTGHKAKARIDFIRRVIIYIDNNNFGCEIRYDGSSVLRNKGKGITIGLQPHITKPLSRMMKLKKNKLKEKYNGYI